MSPELKAKYLKHLKGLHITESMIETAYGEGEEKGILKGFERGVEQGIERGIQQGIETSRINTILKANQAEIPISLIAELVALTEQDVCDVLKANDRL